MKEMKWGRIVTIGSVQEAKPHPDMLVYSASKAAQSNMVQSLSLQLAKNGITVNNVAPGVIDTDMNAGYSEDVMEALAAQTPLGRIGEAEEVAESIYFLASEASGFITGQILGVNGGFVI
jgi:NAD(P)-dependent dehydrogenase (short-subunit alcohol dehydrogenase family)